jgi:hypothetical protein
MGVSMSASGEIIIRLTKTFSNVANEELIVFAVMIIL